MGILNKTRVRRIKEYFLGLSYTYGAVIVFAALGWIDVTADFVASNLVVTFLIACVVWTALILVGIILWVVLFVVASSSEGLGWVFGLLGLAVVGYALLKLAEFLLPRGWVTFTGNEFAFLVMGVVFAVIHIFADKEKTRALGKALEKMGDEY